MMGKEDNGNGEKEGKEEVGRVISSWGMGIYGTTGKTRK